MNFHSGLRLKFKRAVVPHCRRSNCRLKLTGSPNPITVLDCDKAPLSGYVAGRRCDFLVFTSEPPDAVVAVEMKEGAWEPREVADQLAGGVTLTDRLAGPHQVSRFIALLLHQGVRHATQLKVLTACKVRFRGKDVPILQKRCGSSLDDVLTSGRSV